jgi:hypothetical protein
VSAAGCGVVWCGVQLRRGCGDLGTFFWIDLKYVAALLLESLTPAEVCTDKRDWFV